jgi:hypothetical protein
MLLTAANRRMEDARLRPRAFYAGFGEAAPKPLRGETARDENGDGNRSEPGNMRLSSTNDEYLTAVNGQSITACRAEAA